MSRNSVVVIDQEPVVRSPYPDRLSTQDRGVRATTSTTRRRIWSRCRTGPTISTGSITIELAIDHGARLTGHHLSLGDWNGAASLDELLVPQTRARTPALDRSERCVVADLPSRRTVPNCTPPRSSTERTDRRSSSLEAVEQVQPLVRLRLVPRSSPPDGTPPGEWYDRHECRRHGAPGHVDRRPARWSTASATFERIQKLANRSRPTCNWVQASRRRRSARAGHP